MKRDVPAPGYQRISGKKNPPANDGGYWVQLRSGWCDLHRPWPASGGGVRWIWGEQHDSADVVAVKKA